MNIKKLDGLIILWLKRSFLPFARFAIFFVYFYFGILKLLGESPATPIANALVEKTIGLSHFNFSFKALAVYECLIGIMFLLPKATRVAIPLVLIHLVLVSLPLILITDLAWTKPFVPSLEGQYIIKNIIIAALAIGIAAQTRPLAKK